MFRSVHDTVVNGGLYLKGGTYFTYNQRNANLNLNEIEVQILQLDQDGNISVYQEHLG